MTTFAWLDVLDDHAGCLGALQAYSIDASVPTPQALHTALKLQSTRPGQVSYNPIYFFLLHLKIELSEITTKRIIDIYERSNFLC